MRTSLLCSGLLFVSMLSTLNAAQVATPVFSPSGGSDTAAIDVQITCATLGATIRYTTDGSTPVLTSPQIPANGLLRIYKPLTLKAKAWRINYTASNVGSGEYFPRRTSVAAQFHTLAINNGNVYGWGLNDGTLATTNYVTDGTTTNRPVKMVGVTNAVAVAGGVDHSLVLKSDGTVWSCGDNFYGQLGNGRSTAVNTNNLVAVKMTNGFTNLNFTVAAGAYHSMAIDDSGAIYSWGGNWRGQLGRGASPGNTLVPGKVVGSSGFIDVEGGEEHSVGLKSDGTVWAWGANDRGQCGANASFTSTSQPVQVKVAGSGALLTSVKQIASGDFHSMALKNDGTVWAWGDNTLGQMAQSGYGGSYRAAYQIEEVGNGVVAIGAGDYFCFAVKTNAIYAWGQNDQGQLANGQIYGSNNVPVAVTGITGAKTSLDGGGSHSLFIKTDNTVWTSGGNDYGQLGNGQTADSKVPVQVNLTITPSGAVK